VKRMRNRPSENVGCMTSGLGEIEDFVAVLDNLVTEMMHQESTCRSMWARENDAILAGSWRPCHALQA